MHRSRPRDPRRHLRQLAIAVGAVASLAALGCFETGQGAGTSAPGSDASALVSREPTPEELKELEYDPGATPPLEDASASAPEPLPDLAGAPGPSPAAGPADAPVLVYLFTDFQCPVCRRAVEPLKLLSRTFGDEVRIVVKHLEGHRDSELAAAASLAAFRQGRFWALHDLLFTEPRRLSREDVLSHAGALGLDLARFERDLDDPALRAQIRYETDLARALDLAATPTLIVNGEVQKGWGSYQQIQGRVARALARATELADTGVPRERLAVEAMRAAGPEGERLARALAPGGS